MSPDALDRPWPIPPLTQVAAPAAPPTPYPDVNAVLQELLAGVQAILGPHFVGLYLGGSLAGGDFDPRRSDVDFLVATADDLPDELVRALVCAICGLSIIKASSRVPRRLPAGAHRVAGSR
jgi:hypothetical protein